MEKRKKTFIAYSVLECVLVFCLLIVILLFIKEA